MRRRGFLAGMGALVAGGFSQGALARRRLSWQQPIQAKLSGPEVRSEKQLRAALADVANRVSQGLGPGSIFIAADFTLGETIELTGSRYRGLEIAGIGRRLISTTYTGSPVFYIESDIIRLRDLQFGGDHRVGGTDIEINGAARLQLDGIDGGATTFLESTSGGTQSTAIAVTGCFDCGHVDVDVNTSRFVGNDLANFTITGSFNTITGNTVGTITVAANGQQNTFTGNTCDDATDAASNGQNAFVANVVGGTLTWTGAGSSAANNV